MRPRIRTLRLLAALCAVSFLSVLAVQAEERRGEFGVVAGVILPDDELDGSSGADFETTLGLRTGSWFAPRWVWSTDALFSEFETETFAGDARQTSLRTGLDWLLQPDRDPQWFVSFGAGYTDLEFDSANDFFSAFASLGGGQRIWLNDRMHYRWEVRVDRSLADDGLRGNDITQAAFLVSLNWGSDRPAAAVVARPTRPKREPKPKRPPKPLDSDGDGIFDDSDRCPGTPAGAPIDAAGCPVEPDRDDDGIADDADRCPDTPTGARVGPDGCPPDADGDGVPDAADRCPDTPAGSAVDPRGCHADADGDGVPDGIDECPETLKGIKVDGTGCFLDIDRDGVYDGLGMDRCPNTPRGLRVGPDGCPLDSDRDGVPDGQDQCNDTPVGAVVDGRGCPRDSDADGVFDGIDQCPGTPAKTRVNPQGCPAAPGLFDKGTTVVLRGVTFETNSARLTAAARTTLDSVAEQLLAVGGDHRIEIAGHTDSTGDEAYNRRLSQQRADAVLQYLVSRGVARGRLTSRGYGETVPVDENQTAEGRARNRRVELKKL